jgi:hypothetical protein
MRTKAFGSHYEKFIDVLRRVTEEIERRNAVQGIPIPCQTCIYNHTPVACPSSEAPVAPSTSDESDVVMAEPSLPDLIDETVPAEPETAEEAVAT